MTCGPKSVEEAVACARKLGVRFAEDVAAARGNPEQRKLVAENRREFQKKVRENSGQWKHEHAFREARHRP